MEREKDKGNMKTLYNSDVSGTRVNVPDVQTFGNIDTFELICKVSSKSEGWMKSTKAMFVGNGCLVQVTTQQQNPDGSYAVAEALAFVPGATIQENIDESGNVIGRSVYVWQTATGESYGPSSPSSPLPSLEEER